MLDRPSPKPLRRQHPRADLAATALLVTRSRLVGPCVIENLSLGGVRLACDEPLRRGQKLQVLLDLPRWCCGSGIPAEVRRRERRDGGGLLVGVAFTELSAPLRGYLEELVASQLLATFPSIEFFDTERGGGSKRILLGENPLHVKDREISPL